jgi:uncharacterized DUF497 family protein
MTEGMFEWEEAKAEANYIKHGVDFLTACQVFGDPFGIERSDSLDYGEDRFLITAMGGGSLLTVVYTERGESLRIISARRETKREYGHYYIQNSQA